MNAVNTVLVFATVVVAGVGPFVAVYRGAQAFDSGDEPDEARQCTDDTIPIPRITDDPYQSTTKGHRMKTITMYEPGDLLTATQAADVLGYSRDYFLSMLQINDKAADLKLIRLKIETDETRRKANRSRARHVFEYGELTAWYRAKQRRREVKAKTWARKGKPSPLL